MMIIESGFQLEGFVVGDVSSFLETWNHRRRCLRAYRQDRLLGVYHAVVYANVDRRDELGVAL